MTPEVIQRVLDECPDAEWRLLIGLSRWGGLRCPSEHLALTWQDIDWDRGTIRVHSPKTEHHAGHAFRIVLMFPELRVLLMDAYEAAPEGAKYVITQYRDAKQNLRTQFTRIIKRAGLEPWPRLWQNLRAGRETELMREYDLATVCAWIGNSPAVAAKHYAMSVDRDADFLRAVGSNEEAQQKSQQSASATASRQTTPKDENVYKPLETNNPDISCHLLTSAVGAGIWAIQDPNPRT